MGKAAAIVLVLSTIVFCLIGWLDLMARYLVFGFPPVAAESGVFGVTAGMSVNVAEQQLVRFGIIRDDLPQWAVQTGNCRGHRRNGQTEVRNYRDEGWARIGGCLVVREGRVIDGGFSSSLGVL